MVEPVTVNQERLVQTFLDMVRVNTPPKQEKAASEVAYRILLDLGFDCVYDDAGEKVGGNVGNLIAFKKGTVEKRSNDLLFRPLRHCGSNSGP